MRWRASSETMFWRIKSSTDKSFSLTEAEGRLKRTQNIDTKCVGMYRTNTLKAGEQEKMNTKRKKTRLHTVTPGRCKNLPARGRFHRVDRRSFDGRHWRQQPRPTLLLQLHIHAPKSPNHQHIIQSRRKRKKSIRRVLSDTMLLICT